jgi:fatty acid desaturase
MRQPRSSRRPEPRDQRDARRFTLILALITLAAVILLATLIAPSTIPLSTVWPPVIALITVAVRLYLRPQR